MAYTAKVDCPVAGAAEYRIARIIQVRTLKMLDVLLCIEHLIGLCRFTEVPYWCCQKAFLLRAKILSHTCYLRLSYSRCVTGKPQGVDAEAQILVYAFPLFSLRIVTAFQIPALQKARLEEIQSGLM
jgi:hypothetical protein